MLKEQEWAEDREKVHKEINPAYFKESLLKDLYFARTGSAHLCLEGRGKISSRTAWST